MVTRASAFPFEEPLQPLKLAARLEGTWGPAAASRRTATRVDEDDRPPKETLIQLLFLHLPTPTYSFQLHTLQK